MIDPKSASYPILGAAQAHGVDYGLALELAFCVVHCQPLTERRDRSLDAVLARHGCEAMVSLHTALQAAKDEGRLYSGGVA